MMPTPTTLTFHTYLGGHISVQTSPEISRLGQPCDLFVIYRHSLPLKTGSCALVQILAQLFLYWWKKNRKRIIHIYWIWTHIVFIAELQQSHSTLQTRLIWAQYLERGGLLCCVVLCCLQVLLATFKHVGSVQFFLHYSCSFGYSMFNSYIITLC